MFAATSTYDKQNSKAIWDEDEVPEGAQFDDLTDPRPEPEYVCVCLIVVRVFSYRFNTDCS